MELFNASNNKEIYMFIYELLIIDFVRTDNFISYKLI